MKAGIDQRAYFQYALDLEAVVRSNATCLFVLQSEQMVKHDVRQDCHYTESPSR